MNNMPVVSDQNKLDRMGSALFETQFAKSLILVPHDGNTDFGIDYNAELIDTLTGQANTITGIFASIQLKSHKSIVFNNEGEFLQQFKTSTANYWLNSSMPVFLVLVDIDAVKIYGIDAKEMLRNNYDAKKMKQQTVSLKVTVNDIFNETVFLKGCVNDLKYRTLLSASNDSYNIFNYIQYFNAYSHRDWHMEVDSYDDFTGDILDLVKKYSVPFSFDDKLVDYKKQLYDSIKDHLIDGRILYDGYLEQDRTAFNAIAFDYCSELVLKICQEIDKDKTCNLSLKLYKFKRLFKLIQDCGKPGWNSKWSNLSSNELNSDFRFDD